MYVQAAMLAAKYGKQIAIGLVILVVIAGLRFAVNMHERTVAELASTAAALSSSRIAQETTLASLESQKLAAQMWQDSAERHKVTLENQERAQRRARAEGDKIAKTLLEHDLERLARKKPGLVEGVVNRATARNIRLLNCKSASSCEGDNRTSRSDAAHPTSRPPLPGAVPVDDLRAGIPAQSRRSLFLPSAHGLRSSRT